MFKEDIYNESEYQRFYENLIPLLKGENIRTVTLKEIKSRALSTGIRTKYGSYVWRSAVSSRIAPKTVYLGSESIRLPRPSDLQKSIIKNAPEELHKVLHLIRKLPFIHLRRQMCRNSFFNPICNLYLSVADPKNYRIAYMWGNTLREVKKNSPGPELIMIHIPEEHQLRQQVLTLPEYNLNIALATDYMGEEKKGFLRQAMYCADKEGMLGLHSGTKIVIIKDKSGRLRKYGVFMFGLTATGKSTWSCHQLGLNYREGERTVVIQDDIVFLNSDGSALGTEQSFFVKTDVEKKVQEALYYALIDKTALLENVMIDADGKVDFLDESLCANGRAIIRRDRLRIKIGHRLKCIASKSINLPPIEELDGLIFTFITRRNTIMPFSQQLTPEEGVLAYLWGESTHSYASQPLRAGESVRIVGTDPFIIGKRGRKVNKFYEIVMGLVEKYRDKIKFFQYNTGGVGEIIEKYQEFGKEKRRIVRKVERVPIELMAAIQRGDLREINKYEKGRFGTEEIKEVEGKSLKKYDPKNYYSEEEIERYLEEIIEGRKKFTEEIAEEGLLPEIVRLAERSFEIVKPKKVKITVKSDIVNSKKKEDTLPEVEKEFHSPFISPSKRIPRFFK
jgi:phosphoenolpyruvate carboxykinase (ATP)